MPTESISKTIFCAGFSAIFALTGCLEKPHEATKHGEHGEHEGTAEHGKSGGHGEEAAKLVATSPKTMDVVLTQPYVCQIHARRHIELRALVEGYLEKVEIREGQTVKEGDILFKIFPPLYEARLASAKAEVLRAQVEYDNTKKLLEKAVVSEQELRLKQAELAKAEAELKLADAEFNFTRVKAPFDGIIDRTYQQQGSLVKEEDLLTTLSDTQVMWVYFNVPEARYFEFKNRQAKTSDYSRLELKDSTIELKLADGTKFQHSPGNTVTIEGQFNNETGNIPFRADFPNPEGLLRHGQTGTILVNRAIKNAIVIPQRATFEILDNQYVWVIGEDHVIRQRPIEVEHELEDVFVLKSGLKLEDKFILEGIRHVHDGQKAEAEFLPMEEALSTRNFHAE